MKNLGQALAAVITLSAAWLVLDLTRLGTWLGKRWDDLDNTQGFVIGAVVALVGVLLNNVALARLEAARHKRTREVADIEYEREVSRRLTETRRDLYGTFLTELQGSWYIARIADTEVRKARREEIALAAAATFSQIRLMSDRKDVVRTSRRFGRAAVRLASKDDADRKKEFNDARTAFVELARAELGRHELSESPLVDPAGAVDADAIANPDASVAENSETTAEE